MTGPELLREELARRGIRPAEAARQLDVSKVTMGEWLSGGKRPSHARALAIEAWSARRIPARSWLTAEEAEHIVSLASQGSP